jgi:hypothetical protein
MHVSARQEVTAEGVPVRAARRLQQTETHVEHTCVVRILSQNVERGSSAHRQCTWLVF